MMVEPAQMIVTRTTAGTTYERELAEKYGVVVGVDEVGRGCLAGPVTVGVATMGCGEVPAGLTDSKLLSPSTRARLIGQVSAWGTPCAVASATAEEIDRWGIIHALRLAGWRALESLYRRGLTPGVILLDGSHDWLSADLMSAEQCPIELPPVITRVKADRDCAVVAAASVLAKVSRDAVMTTVGDPGYRWESNKGYGSCAHRQAIELLGIHPLHRHTWNLGAPATTGQ